MQHQAEEAVNALSEVDLGPESLTSMLDYSGAEDDPELMSQEGHLDVHRSAFPGLDRRAVIATTAAMLVLVLLFFIPWRVEGSSEVMWAPIYRPPVKFITTFQEMGGFRGSYQTGEVALDILLLQLVGISALGWVGSVMAGAMSRDPTLSQ